MIVVEKNKGRKIPYKVKGTKIDFNEDLRINLAKYQREEKNTVDICSDDYGCLYIGVSGVSSKYVASIIIPAREYDEIAVEDENEMGGSNTVREPKKLDMDKVTLELWEVEDEF